MSHSVHPAAPSGVRRQDREDFATHRVARLAARCGAALVGLLAAASAAVAEPSRYDAARDAYEVGHYEQAFAVFAHLADDGHCDAARIARQMVRYGRPLYAIEFKVAPERIERWERVPACAPARTAAR